MSNEANNSTSRLYKMGRNVFYVVNCAASYIEYLDQLLPFYSGPELSEEEIVEVRSGCSTNVSDVIGYVLPRNKHYVGCAWVEATLLISPTGQTVIIAGKSAGRTTTALALGLGYGWKVAAENSFIVDYMNKKLVAYNTPFSFQAPTIELLHRSLGRVPDPVFEPFDLRGLRKWSPLGELSAEVDYEYDLRFDSAILLERSEQDAVMQVSPVSAGEFLVKLIPHSNLLRAGASTLMIELLTTSSCLRISGGELEERLAVIMKHSQPVEPQNANLVNAMVLDTIPV